MESGAVKKIGVFWETALSHFALVVIDPTDIDYVELGPLPNRRTRFWKNEKGSWSEEGSCTVTICVPSFVLFHYPLDVLDSLPCTSRDIT